jgi:hypothetical protein
MDAAQHTQPGADTPTEERTMPGLIHHARPLTQVVEFGTFRDPEQALVEAELVAKAFARRAAGLNLFKQIGDSKHLKIEGWQMLAMMYRVTAGVVETTYVEVGNFTGYEATAEALLIRGSDLPPQRISTAQAMCLNDEERWDVRPEYEYVNGKRQQSGEVAVPLQQLRSMAQTRACSKVLSNLLKFVAVMAGYAGTPAEEMTGRETERQPAQQPQRTQNGNGIISDKQVGRLWAIAKNSNKSDEAVGVILEAFKYSTADGIRAAADQIKRTDYDAIVSEVMKP